MELQIAIYIAFFAYIYNLANVNQRLVNFDIYSIIRPMVR
jgi:hypothetical protein